MCIRVCVIVIASRVKHCVLVFVLLPTWVSADQASDVCKEHIQQLK